MKERMRKMPRPVPRKRFSGARGSGSVSGSSAFALVGDGNHQDLCRCFQSCTVICLAGSYSLPCKHGVDGGLAHGHGELEALVLVEAGLCGQLLGGGFHLADAFHGGTERKTQRSFPGCAHRIRIRLFRNDGDKCAPPRLSNLAGSFIAGGDCVKTGGGQTALRQNLRRHWALSGLNART